MVCTGAPTTTNTPEISLRSTKSEDEERDRLGHLSNVWPVSVLFEHISDHWHDRIGRRRHQGNLSRRFLQQYGFAPWPTWLICGQTVALIAIIPLLFFIMNIDHSHRHIALTPWSYMTSVVLIMTVAGPQLLVVTMLSARRPRLAHELLFPCTREQWIDGIVRTLIRQAAGIAVLGLFGSVLSVAHSHPELLTSGKAVCYIPLIVAVQALGCMIGLWSVAFRDRGAEKSRKRRWTTSHRNKKSDITRVPCAVPAASLRVGN